MAEGRYVEREMIRTAKMTIIELNGPGDAELKTSIEAWNQCCDALADNLPGVDIPGIKIGTWAISSDGYYPYCSVCLFEPAAGQRLSRYCPECGARMVGRWENG